MILPQASCPKVEGARIDQASTKTTWGQAAAAARPLRDWPEPRVSPRAKAMAPKKKEKDGKAHWDFGGQSELTQELGIEASSRLAEQYAGCKRAKLKSDLAACLTAWLMGTKKDVVWTEELAVEKWQGDRGNAKSIRLLGVSYEMGRGQPKDLKAARKCFLKAAMMGDVTAQRYVAGCYFRGVGGDVNYDEAFRWRVAPRRPRPRGPRRDVARRQVHQGLQGGRHQGPGGPGRHVRQRPRLRQGRGRGADLLPRVPRRRLPRGQGRLRLAAAA